MEWKMIERKDGTVVIEARWEDDWLEDRHAEEELADSRMLGAGHIGCLGVRSHTHTGAIYEAWLTEGTIDGISGNMHPFPRRFHGWRGTTNDQMVHAYGQRKVVESRPLTRGHGRRIVLSVDLLPDEK